MGIDSGRRVFLALSGATVAVAIVSILGSTALAGGVERFNDPDPLLERARALFEPLSPPAAGAVEAPAAVLGRRLFWDARLSGDGRTACASCHTVEAFGADERRFSVDARRNPTERNSQTVFNSMVQPSLRWLGDRRDGAHQAERSIVGSMGFGEVDDIISMLSRHGYLEAFGAAFPGEAAPVSPLNYGRALEAYQRTLVTPAPFDAYLDGNPDALDGDQVRGLEVFISTGCAVCHSGSLLGGAASQRFGVVEEYWTATGSEKIDVGRYAITSEESDRYVFRVPMLRNIARTAPYFHDGSVPDLGAAVRVMSRVQLGRTLSDPDVDLIVAFLESLTGEVPAHYSPPRDSGGE